MLPSQHAEHKLMVEPYPQSVRHDALDAEVIVVGVELLAPEHGTLCHWRLRPTLLPPEHGTMSEAETDTEIKHHDAKMPWMRKS